jgi:hypothetical protein
MQKGITNEFEMTLASGNKTQSGEGWGGKGRGMSERRRQIGFD